MNARHVPNLITSARLASVPFLVWALLQAQYPLALGLCALMGLTDALDGFLAKRFDWVTQLGRYLDPLADKVMLVSAYVTLGVVALLPAWLVVLVVLRDAVILAGALAYRLTTRALEIRPTGLSKLNTVVQIALALAVIFDRVVALPVAVLTTLVVLTVVTTVASGLSYVVEWSRLARVALRQ